jgi:DNA-binding transcriptional MerR regulator
MTEDEFCEKAGLSRHQLRTWLESGLLEAKMVNDTRGPRQEFDAHQLSRARLLKALSICSGRLEKFLCHDGDQMQSCHSSHS